MTCGVEGVPGLIGRDGGRVSAEKARVGSEVFWGVVGNASKGSSEKGDVGIDESLRDYLVEKVPDAVRKAVEKGTGEIEHSQEEIDKMIQLVLDIADIWGAYIGSSTDQQSLKYLWLEECLDGENLFCAGTYQKVLEHIVLAKPLADKAEIHLNTVVKQIRGRESGRHEQVIVVTEDEQEMKFDEVVMTAPLGWLKRNLDCFVPNVPNGFKTAVESLGYGMLDKVYISFEEPFWQNPDTSVSQNAGAEEKTTPEEPSPVPDTVPIDSHQDSPAAKSTSGSITTFLRPQYVSTSPIANLTQDCINLAALPKEVAHPTLLFYTSNPTTSILSSLTSSHKDNDTPFSIPVSADHPLIPLFEPYYSKLFGQSQKMPKPTAILFTNWYADPFAGHGSYTFFPAGQNNLDKHVETLREGMPDRGIWIAGEHTAPFVALGTVTGAWMSGESVAQRILERDQAKK